MSGKTKKRTKANTRRRKTGKAGITNGVYGVGKGVRNGVFGVGKGVRNGVFGVGKGIYNVGKGVTKRFV
jgi:hypothetical protein